MPLVRILADRPIKAGAGEAEDTADGQAQVQDTEDSLEVIVVRYAACCPLRLLCRNSETAAARR